MQKVSSKKMSHKEAKEYREAVQDSVMYQHSNGSVYMVYDLARIKYDGLEGKAVYVTDDINELLIG